MQRWAAPLAMRDIKLTRQYRSTLPARTGAAPDGTVLLIQRWSASSGPQEVALWGITYSQVSMHHSRKGSWPNYLRNPELTWVSRPNHFEQYNRGSAKGSCPAREQTCRPSADSRISISRRFFWKGLVLKLCKSASDMFRARPCPGN